MGNKHERSSTRHTVAYARTGRKLADSLTSNTHNRDGRIESCGVKTEVMCISKLGCARIIPTAGKKSAREKCEGKGRGLSISIQDEIVAKDRLCFSQTYDRPSDPDPANPGDSVIHI
jgi:hypothetical protein